MHRYWPRLRYGRLGNGLSVVARKLIRGYSLRKRVMETAKFTVQQG